MFISTVDRPAGRQRAVLMEVWKEWRAETRKGIRYVDQNSCAVDDCATERAIIKDTLGGYCVLTASGGTEAMRMLREHEGINLMILDLNIPDMDGFQV